MVIATKRIATALRGSAPGFGFDPAGQGDRGKQWLKDICAIADLMHSTKRYAFVRECMPSDEAFAATMRGAFMGPKLKAYGAQRSRRYQEESE